MRKATYQDIVSYQFDNMAVPTINHGVFTRLGGHSKPPWDTLNVGHTVGDDLADVEANHGLIYAALGISASQVVTAHQVHGTHVARVGLGHGGQVMADTDALITNEPGVMLMLRFADCMPILLHDPVTQAVGLAHAGWRGTIGNVVGATIAAMQKHFGTTPANIMAGLGPSIRACCYQVGETVIEAANATWTDPDVFLPAQADGSVHFDLVGTNRYWLAEAGVTQVEVAPVCTACCTDQFYSHRAEQGKTGRFAALLGLRGENG